MGKIKNIAGKKFGQLLVLKDSGKRAKSGRVLWLCKCDCGNTAEINSKYLLSEDTQSCGCLKPTLLHKNTDKVGEISKSFWSRIKRGAKQRNLEFKITREYAWSIFLKQQRKCSLTEMDIHLPKYHGKRSLPNRGRNHTASLDRIDNSKGYIIGNVRWLHKDVNKMKNTHEEEYFINICKKISNINNKKPLVAVSGGLDPVHYGHVRMIKEAAKYGRVVVILNSDEWLTRKKGKPFMCWEERAEIVGAFRDVYRVSPVDDSDGTVCEALKRIKPAYFANGGDRKSDNVPEVQVCQELDIEMLWNIGGDKIQSSSNLIANAKEGVS